MIPSTIPNPQSAIRNPQSICPACSSDQLYPFYQQAQVPVHSTLLMNSREEALAIGRGDLDLAYCRRCGFITNLAYDSKLQDYSTNYEDSQGFSPTFTAFAESQAKKLIEAYGIRGKTVLEIGCGKGDFLELICRLGENLGLGFDPSYPPGRQTGQNLRFMQELYCEKHADLPADLICCRHTLEHIGPVGEFLRMLRRNLGERENTLIFFEVPDTTRILRENAFWDFYYEHCSYFTLDSLRRAFISAGFRLDELYRTYGDQYLVVIARPGKTTGNTTKLPAGGHDADLRDSMRLIRTFQENVPRFSQKWAEKIRSWRGQKVVLWGSGSKAAGFLSILPENPIELVVDINPYKKDKFMPGSACRIVAPDYLPVYNPKRVVIMNPIYQKEIQEQLARLGVPAEVMTIMDI